MWVAGFTVLATIAAFIIHEIGHYLAAEALGFDSWFSLNYSGIAPGSMPTQIEITLFTLAGPAVTVLQAFLAAIFIGKGRQLWLYALVAIAFWQRVTAFVISVLAVPNDEARISLMWGWDLWVLPSIVVALLGAILVWAALKARAGLIANLVIYLATTLGITMVVFGDRLFFFRIG